MFWGPLYYHYKKGPYSKQQEGPSANPVASPLPLAAWQHDVRLQPLGVLSSELLETA